MAATTATTTTVTPAITTTTTTTTITMRTTNHTHTFTITITDYTDQSDIHHAWNVCLSMCDILSCSEHARMTSATYAKYIH